MLPLLAELGALAERIGVDLDPDSPEGLRATAALADASALVRSEGRRDWVDDHDELELFLPDVISSVTLQAALRAFRNPDGFAQTTVGDVSVSYGASGGQGGVYLTRDEKRQVRRAAGTLTADSVQLETPYGITGGGDLLLAPVAGESEMIPLGPVPWEA